jgi:Trk K+ transport system NAD-binding subunit
MKILCIGAGSMGRRRLRDLTYLNEGNVILFEPEAQRCGEIAAAFGVAVFTTRAAFPSFVADRGSD